MRKEKYATNFYIVKKHCLNAHLFLPSLYVNNIVTKKARNKMQQVLKNLEDIVNEKNLDIHKKEQKK